MVEAAIHGFFDPREHAWLLQRRRLRMAARALLGLIRRWLNAGIREPAGRGIHPDPGVPPGGVVSPV